MHYKSTPAVLQLTQSSTIALHGPAPTRHAAAPRLHLPQAHFFVPPVPIATPPTQVTLAAQTMQSLPSRIACLKLDSPSSQRSLSYSATLWQCQSLHLPQSSHMLAALAVPASALFFPVCSTTRSVTQIVRSSRNCRSLTMITWTSGGNRMLKVMRKTQLSRS